MSWVGVDVGGTFTDVVVYDPRSGDVRSGKSPSTPQDTSAGVLRALAAMGVDLAQVERFRHGATVATNTALERAGAVLGVITTAGHRDVLIVGRGNRTRLYDIKATRPPGLVRRSRVMEVPERIAPDGSVVVALDEAAVAAAAARLAALGTESVAVCFLHSYADAAHEIRAAEIVTRALPGVPVSRSCEVLPEQREYERFATTALNAYVAPRMARYLERLHTALRAGGLRIAPEIMTSGGGSWTFERMARLPVNSMLSGPAGGVIGAVEFAAALDAQDIVSYDMGGTSTDTCLVRGGRYALASEGTIAGFPNRAPQIEINTVGAGGGSIAYLDAGGFLNVGPRSAGAIPGPACYGRGGVEPTVTDANVVLGRFRPGEPLGGEIVIDVAAAERAVDALAARLGLDRMATAEGIVRLAVTRMTGAIKEISVMRGIDPRDFTLFAFGGAGPLHAAPVAEELGIRTILVPPLPGAFSAYGLLVADRRRDASLTRVMRMDGATLDEVLAIIEPMRAQAGEELAGEGFGPDRVRYEAFVDMRFAGQAFELTTPLPPDARSIEDLVAAFHREYEQRYAHADRGTVEAVSFRVTAYGLTDKPRVPVIAAGGTAGDALAATRPVHFAGRTHDTPVYRREALGEGAVIAGPAVIEEAGSATVVPPGFTARAHASGALILTREVA
jgi:N-methylhydantoinase A